MSSNAVTEESGQPTPLFQSIVTHKKITIQDYDSKINRHSKLRQVLHLYNQGKS